MEVMYRLWSRSVMVGGFEDTQKCGNVFLQDQSSFQRLHLKNVIYSGTTGEG